MVGKEKELGVCGVVEVVGVECLKWEELLIVLNIVENISKFVNDM